MKLFTRTTRRTQIYNTGQCCGRVYTVYGWRVAKGIGETFSARAITLAPTLLLAPS